MGVPAVFPLYYQRPRSRYSPGQDSPTFMPIERSSSLFVQVVDPVGSGYVESLARPGGNVTGFLLFEYSLAGKWLELLKQVAPDVTRAAVLRDADVRPI